jgi:hypothetical protein
MSLSLVCTGIKDMIPSVDQSGNYEGFDALVEKSNTWLREQKDAMVLNLQSILIHKAIGNCCCFLPLFEGHYCTAECC